MKQDIDFGTYRLGPWKKDNTYLLQCDEAKVANWFKYLFYRKQQGPPKLMDHVDVKNCAQGILSCYTRAEYFSNCEKLMLLHVYNMDL